MQGLHAAHGKDAFHRVPDFTRNNWDAVERVPTGQSLLARAIWLALPATRAVSTTKQNKVRKQVSYEDIRHPTRAFGWQAHRMGLALRMRRRARCGWRW